MQVISKSTPTSEAVLRILVMKSLYSFTLVIQLDLLMMSAMCDTLRFIDDVCNVSLWQLWRTQERAALVDKESSWGTTWSVGRVF